MNTDPPAPIAIENLRLRYPETGRVVLHGVNMRLGRGEVKLLLGPSGVGKSSLALTLNGLIPLQMDGEIKGTVVVNGRPTLEAGVPWLTSRVGILFQDPEAQIATLTVGDEVAFGLENLLVPPGEMPARTAEALERVGLQGMESRSTDALSGGQKQRLALASTLAMGVTTLVFDEPTANLDPAGTAEVFALLAELKAEGAAILVIEHKLDQLISEVDSIDVLDWTGTMATSGPPRDVLEGHAGLLADLGVWVPQVSELANALRREGLELDPYPVTIDEAAAALDKLLGSRPPVVQRAAVAAENPGSGVAAAEVSGLSYQYPDGNVALREASLSVAEGDFYAILGPNGSGKTTLARHLIGLLKAQEGTVRVLGEDVGRIPARELNSRVGYVFQNPEHQFVTLNVYDELSFSLRARKLPEDEVKRRVEALLAEFGLEEHRGANPFSLSQGQKRRLSVATMLALDPRVLILDEPTFGQDRLNTTRIMEQLCALNRRGVTIIIITHDMKLVAEYANRVGVLVEGRVEFEGPTRELYADPDLLWRANLEAPPLFEVSCMLRERHPDFPLLMTVSEFKEEICALSGICRETASSTA
ncbi:MAG: ABC transporter ATP-binding protein [Chloroflexia bacterium]